MKAVVYTEYGGSEVLKIQELDKPVPKDDEVTIKVYSTTVIPMDWKFRSGKILVARLMSWNVIGRKYSLDEIREAHEYAEQ